jgi:hypothetical protein
VEILKDENKDYDECTTLYNHPLVAQTDVLFWGAGAYDRVAIHALQSQQLRVIYYD